MALFPRRAPRLVATTVAASVLVVALAAPAGAAAPEAWAGSVCGALDTWVSKVDAASAKAAMGAPKSAADVKKRLTRLLATAQAQTRSLVTDLQDAGKPDVKGGQQIAATMREGFTQAQRTISQARKSLAQAPTQDPEAFMTAARTAQDSLEAGLEAIQAAFSAARTADAAPLVEAFAANDDCQIVSA